MNSSSSNWCFPGGVEQQQQFAGSSCSQLVIMSGGNSAHESNNHDDDDDHNDLAAAASLETAALPPPISGGGRSSSAATSGGSVAKERDNFRYLIFSAEQPVCVKSLFDTMLSTDQYCWVEHDCVDGGASLFDPECKQWPRQHFHALFYSRLHITGLEKCIQ